MEWSEARKMGLPSYDTGRPCKRGHLSSRRTDSAACEECLSERSKKQYREDVKSSFSAYRDHLDRTNHAHRIRRRINAEVGIERGDR
ncbi:hypothetical protein UFOVP1244_72 [uncultured Caudovirales phage]|uniref:Uncharacterized protein n=1 Tax=uncultured Caudovirales phage TaxID=2100421 RepID=A0A6J5RGM2_9CAUD|nr:hypothetical protein UFOVP1244_72 [uncultured Caudovirales phage]